MSDVPTLRNIWWVSMWSQDLRLGQLLARRIMDEPLVFYRTDAGTPTALFDRCAHRWAPLSRGKLVAGDRLACPYHGLEYDAQGVCARNPHPNYVIPAEMRVRRYPLAEKHSLIWIWMGNGRPDESLIPDFGLLDSGHPGPAPRRDYLRMDASWDLVTDNLLDTSHVAFLHEGNLGNPSMVDAKTLVEQRDKTHVIVKREFQNIPTTPLWDLLFFNQVSRVNAYINMNWHAPACLINDSGATPTGETAAQGTYAKACHFLTPETETTCHYHFAAVRNNPVRNVEENATLLRRIGEIRRVAFADQDGAMIAAQQQRIAEEGKENLRPVLISADAGIERVHRILRQLRDEERREPAATS